MKRIFRKNQMIITALALLIAVAGYISYTQANTEDIKQAEIGSEQDTSEDVLLDLSEDELADQIFTDTEAPEELASNGENTSGETLETTSDGGIATEEDATDAGVTVLTSSETRDVASQMKLNREQSRSKNKETLLEIINNESLSDAQKEDAIEQLEVMAEVAEKESAAENLLLAKGFTDVVVSITEDEADVVLNMGDVTEAKRAQVEDIVKRKTGVPAENIVITPMNVK